MLLCEKLIHGDRKYLPFPQFHRLVNGKKVPIQQQEYPYKCQKYARKFLVTGQSFSCTATLCELHRRAAVNEGFMLQEIKEPADHENSNLPAAGESPGRSRPA